MDNDGNRRLDSQEFYHGLSDQGCELSQEEVDALMAHLDTDGDGSVNFNEFLTGIRGTPNETRMALIDQAYSKFDANGDGAICASDLRQVYNCGMHPKVISGEITEDEAFLEFLSSYGDKNNDGMITQQEWNDYYAAVSANIDNDDEFCLMMTNAW